MIELDGPVLECAVSFKRGRQGRKHMVTQRRQGIASAMPRVPRLSRHMALAIKLDGQIREGELQDWAEVARLGHLTRARACQISGLLLLAPDIIESILHLPVIERGRDPITERALRPIVAQPSWRVQRRLWQDLVNSRLSGVQQ